MRIDSEVLSVIGRANVEGNLLFLTGQLDRNLYQRTDKVLQAAGGKWNRSKKAHVFEACAEDRIQQLLNTGDIVVPQDFGYFPTPPEVVDILMDLADVKPGHFCLEPSAGQGAIALELIARSGLCQMVELLESNFLKLAEKVQALKDCKTLVLNKDFLTMEMPDNFDRIVMNPPFEKQADIKHVLHAFKFLKPGGRLVSVMSASVEFRDNTLTKAFRELVKQHGGSIEPLPRGAFKSSGTMVNTVVVVIDKP